MELEGRESKESEEFLGIPSKRKGKLRIPFKYGTVSLKEGNKGKERNEGTFNPKVLINPMRLYYGYDIMQVSSVCM